VTRYALYAMCALAATLGVLYFFSQREVASLKLERETDRLHAAQDHANKLQSQAGEHAKQIVSERARSVAALRAREQLLQELRTTKDAQDRLADSVLLAYNRVRQHAADQFGDVSGDTPGHAGSVAGAGKEAVNQDLAEQLSSLGQWCEAGWNRVRAIAAVQAACRQ